MECDLSLICQKAKSCDDQKTWEKLTSTLEKIQSDDEGKGSVSLSASKAKEEKICLFVFMERM